ncbi:fasciclin domain-containing protein [Gluconobacter morbifer]|uniref:FAS1 domain-containing protein n=1 Tax=Gluconobacter morbifer G707 TaxID=1088869 RepID=G6XKN9_9PROT|nr:hypothetical protein [Gluconobacter morbifer]EHH67602.1 hypothetical protein GMO_20550 [Gluconobacter morbifer G707]
MHERFVFPLSFRAPDLKTVLKLGSGLALGLSLSACHEPNDLHDTHWSHNYQDSFETPSSTKMAFMPSTLSKSYVPPKDGAPNSVLAYHAPPSPSYDDRPLDENIAASQELTDYLVAIRATGLIPWISGPGPYTVFAIPNAAMEQMAAKWHGGLMAPAYREQLTHILGYTIAFGKWDEARLWRKISRQHGQPVRLITLYGDILTVSAASGTGELLLSNQVGQTNRLWGQSFPQSNGVLYFTQGALLPVGKAPGYHPSYQHSGG